MDEYYAQPSTSTSQSHTSTQSRSRTQSNRTESLQFDYMQLLEEANSIAENTNVKDSVRQIDSVIDKASKLYLDAQKPTELYLDAKILCSTTNTLEQASNYVDVGEGHFMLFTFAEQFKIKALNNEGKPSIEVLAAAAQPVVRNSIPYWSPLLGSFDFSPERPSIEKKEKERRVYKKDALADQKEPEKLSQLDRPNEAVNGIVEDIRIKLNEYYRNNGQQPIHFFKFVINPSSYAASVENLFHVAFLIHDGHVQLLLDNNEPMICPRSVDKENSNPNAKHYTSVKKQNIFSLSMEEWEGMIAELNIQEAMI